MYVDDIVVMETNPSAVDHLITQLSKEFELVDLQDLQYFLGLKVKRTVNSMILSQQEYLFDLLHMIIIDKDKPVGTLMASNTILNLPDGEPIADTTLYRMTVGSLQYAP